MEGGRLFIGVNFSIMHVETFIYDIMSEAALMLHGSTALYIHIADVSSDGRGRNNRHENDVDSDDQRRKV